MKRPLRICIATCDIVGPIRNGGIGTAYASLAQALAEAGHAVTVLYALGAYCEDGTIGHWRRTYQRAGIRFVPLPPTRLLGHQSLRMADGVYQWLKTHRFDLVHYHEWRGIGAFVAQAKRLGLGFADTTLVAGVHSPTLWQLEGMRDLATPEQLEVDFLEQQSVSRADIAWSPSRYMLTWLKAQGWTLPRRVVIRPNILLERAQTRGRRAQASPELVFFGRLETRKGLDLFCDALDRLVARGLRPRVTFLGKTSIVAGVPTEEFLETRAKAWPFRWRIISTLDRHAAMAYLSKPNRVAVLPSRLDNLPYTVLECLGAGIPCLASDTGGIPEMVRPADRERILFPVTPDGLAERLAEVITHGLAPAALRVAPERTLAEWLAWHEAVGRRRARRPTPPRRVTPGPLVSVCVTTRNRPEFLRAALASIRRQDYRPLEVILVDDGSDKPAAFAELNRLKPEFQARNWRLIRQPNRYLGAARNRAIAAARGRYVLFMDDDNLAERHEIRTFVAAATASRADILTCFLRMFRSRVPSPRRRPGDVWPFLGAALGPGTLRNVFGDANAFVRREVFSRIGGFTELAGVGTQDWELFARAVLAGLKLEVVPEPLVRYRQSATGMLQTTSPRLNHRLALTPYLSILPAPLRSLVHLAAQSSPFERPAPAGPAPTPPVLDSVRRAVIFGSGEGGRRAIGLARRCGWDVGWIVDNNPGMWNRTAHDLPVRAPASLTSGGFDLVVVASLAGKAAISQQLTKMGLSPGEHFVHFLDPIRVGGVTYQLTLP